MSKISSPNIKGIIDSLDEKIKIREEGLVISFDEYLEKINEKPCRILRNIFQIFHDMIYDYIEIIEDKEDPESINYKTINCDELLVKGADTPFFADLPLANRIVRLADSFKEGIKQNKIYIFIGPPGSGKSTFLNNILSKFEQYSYSDEGTQYSVLWKLDRSKISGELADSLISISGKEGIEGFKENLHSNILEVPCPSHDHPFLLIPRAFRKEVLENLIDEETRKRFFYKKEYNWVLKDQPCTICTSIYNALSAKLKSPSEVYKMLYAKRFFFNRRLGESITVFNPADQIPRKFILHNEAIQRELGKIFQNSNLIQYVYSRHAKTNNGIYAIMDVKNNNEKRLIDLHGIISEGIHKIEDIEENVRSLFIAVMNPEDKEKIQEIKSFKDRITEIKINYVLNYSEEVKIYFHAFGKQIRKNFLPGVLENFAKIVVSSRLHQKSRVIMDWIKDPKIYKRYCDDNMVLLKMDLYSNIIPSWLSDEDKKSLNKSVRRKLINESENEGTLGFSGRESINIFNEFYSTYKKKGKAGDEITDYRPITMAEVKEFFEKHTKYSEKLSNGFIDSIIRLYNYNVLQEIKQALFKHNEERVSKDIQNYLFAANYDMGEKLVSPYTEETVEISEVFFESIERHLFNHFKSDEDKIKFRNEIADKMTSVLQNIIMADESIVSTDVYKELYNNYMNNLREDIFRPFIKNTSFENAIKIYGTEKFDIYDARTKEEVSFLINNLMTKFGYTQEGAKQVCLYIISNNIADEFKD